MSKIVGTQYTLCTPSYINAQAGGPGPPPLLNGALSTQFNATFTSPTAPGQGMLNLVIFG